MSALFACTRCHDRHPFEDLSKAEQYCKKCLSERLPTKSGVGNYTKCNYCRSEFQQTDKSSTCKHCTQNEKLYGKPSACEYCSLIAAFVGRHCQRCSSSKKKFGSPQSCEQCKQTCAFDMGSDQKKKTDGKLLCYLCTITFKRVLARAKKLEWRSKSESQSNTPQSNPELSVDHHKHHKHHSHHHKHKHHHKPHHKHKHHHHHHHGDRKHKHELDSNNDKEGSPSAKKMCIEEKSNGVDSSVFDLGNADHMVAITQLKEENESLRRQLMQKEQMLLDKDKKLTELKATNYESEKELRQKLTKAQSEHTTALESVQSKNRELQKQVAALSKSKKTE